MNLRKQIQIDGIWNEKFNFCEQNHGVNKKQNKTQCRNYKSEFAKENTENRELEIEHTNPRPYKNNILSRENQNNILSKEENQNGGKK